jgi:septum site-determining protein MinD
MGKIIAIHSYKGGTGKTLFSVNLATTFALKGKKACLLDMDFRAPSLHAIFKVNNVECWLNDYLNGTCTIQKALVDLSEISGGKGKLLVGLANPSTEAIRDMSAKDRKWEMRALGRLLSLRNSVLDEMGMDYLIFDTSPGLQYSSINAIVSADLVFVISTIDASDVQGTKRMLCELYDLFEKKTYIILNKVLMDISSKRGKEELSERLGNTHTLPIFEIVPCFCDILKAGGTYIVAKEKPQHFFSKMLCHMTEKINHL